MTVDSCDPAACSKDCKQAGLACRKYSFEKSLSLTIQLASLSKETDVFQWWSQSSSTITTFFHSRWWWRRRWCKFAAPSHLPFFNISLAIINTMTKFSSKDPITLSYTPKYSRLWHPMFLTFGYGLIRMTNIHYSWWWRWKFAAPSHLPFHF